MTDYEQQLLAALERISAQQINTTTALQQVSAQQGQLLSSFAELIQSLQKPVPTTNTLAELERLLQPLVQQLGELSRKLPEPPHGSPRL